MKNFTTITKITELPFTMGNVLTIQCEKHIIQL